MLGQQEASLNRKVAALSGDLKNEEEAKYVCTCMCVCLYVLCVCVCVCVCKGCV